MPQTNAPPKKRRLPDSRSRATGFESWRPSPRVPTRWGGRSTCSPVRSKRSHRAFRGQRAARRHDMKTGAKLTLVCPKCGRSFQRYRSNVRTANPVCGPGCVDNAASATSHGMSRHALYRVWLDMKQRCHNPNLRAFSYYGGRGISVCDHWRNSFEEFSGWAFANGWMEGLELDRCDVNGNYCPENCRWATRSQQMVNTRKRINAKTSQFKGVSWCTKAGKWRAQFGRDRRIFHIGLFSDEETAARAYDAVITQNYGEFANPNFPRKEGVSF